MDVFLSKDDIINSSIILHCLGAEVPSIVVVEKIAETNSLAGIRSLLTTSGSTIVMLA